MFRLRFALVLAAAVLSPTLFGCGPARLHVLIPDYIASDVDGLHLYRVGAGDALSDAGVIVFGGIILTTSGFQMQYTQVTGSTVFGPLLVPVSVPKPGQVQLELTFMNPGAPGYFRVASYNALGTSKPALGQVYAGGAS